MSRGRKTLKYGKHVLSKSNTFKFMALPINEFLRPMMKVFLNLPRVIIFCKNDWGLMSK